MSYWRNVNNSAEERACLQQGSNDWNSGYLQFEWNYKLVLIIIFSKDRNTSFALLVAKFLSMRYIFIIPYLRHQRSAWRQEQLLTDHVKLVPYRCMMDPFIIVTTDFPSNSTPVPENLVVEDRHSGKSPRSEIAHSYVVSSWTVDE